MNAEDFNKLVERRIDLIKKVLIKKGKEYSSENDRLHNFKVAAAIDMQSPVEALWGMAKKHLVSIIDMKNGIAKNGTIYNQAYVDEKIGDMINYLILLEALIEECSKDDNKLYFGSSDIISDPLPDKLKVI